MLSIEESVLFSNLDFSCLIAMPTTSSIMANRNGKRRHSCHADTTGKALNNSQ